MFKNQLLASIANTGATSIYLKAVIEVVLENVVSMEKAKDIIPLYDDVKIWMIFILHALTSVMFRADVCTLADRQVVQVVHTSLTFACLLFDDLQSKPH